MSDDAHRGGFGRILPSTAKFLGCTAKFLGWIAIIRCRLSDGMWDLQPWKRLQSCQGRAIDPRLTTTYTTYSGYGSKRKFGCYEKSATGEGHT